MIRKAVMFRNTVFTHPYWHVDAICLAARTFGVPPEMLEDEWDPDLTHGYFDMSTGEFKPSGAPPHPYKKVVHS